MSTTFNFPKYKAVVYLFKPETGYYTKTEKQPEKTPVMRLPYEFKRAPTQEEKIKCNAAEVLVSRERSKTGSYKFITGLQETGLKDWYLGNDYIMKNGSKIISIILFHFKEENSRLEAYYFSNYDKRNTDERLKFAINIIPNILEKQTAK